MTLDTLDLTAGVNHAYSLGILVSIWFKQELVLVYEHSHGYPGHVEPVQEVLDGHVCLLVHCVRLLQLQHPLGHSLHYVCVASLYSF